MKWGGGRDAALPNMEHGIQGLLLHHHGGAHGSFASQLIAVGQCLHARNHSVSCRRSSSSRAAFWRFLTASRRPARFSDSILRSAGVKSSLASSPWVASSVLGRRQAQRQHWRRDPSLPLLRSPLKFWARVLEREMWLVCHWREGPPFYWANLGQRCVGPHELVRLCRPAGAYAADDSDARGPLEMPLGILCTFLVLLLSLSLPLSPTFLFSIGILTPTQTSFSKSFLL
jgi:hypothetical protein